MSELLQAVDQGEVGATILLDLTAALIDLWHRQQRASTVSVVSRWSDAIRSSRCSLITHHPSAVQCNAMICSGTAAVHFVYLQPHSIEGHGLGPHLYADDTQVSGS